MGASFAAAAALALVVTCALADAPAASARSRRCGIEARSEAHSDTIVGMKTESHARGARSARVILGAGHPSPSRACAPRAPRTSTPPSSRPRPSARPAATSSASPSTAPKDVEALAEIRRQTTANLVVDLQENYRLAEQVAPHVDKLRYNPGHLYHHEKEKPVAREGPLPGRRGARARLRDPRRRQLRQRRPRDEGALPRGRRGGHGRVGARALPRCSTTSASTATWSASRTRTRARSSRPTRRFAALRPDVPLHLGVTEAGIPPEGVIKTRVAFEQLALARHRRHAPREPHPAQPAQARGDHGRPADPRRHRGRPLPLGARLRRRQAQHHLLPVLLARRERAVRGAGGGGEGDDRLRRAPRAHDRGHGLPRERPGRDRRRRPRPLVRPHPRQPEAEDRDAWAPTPTTRSCRACAQRARRADRRARTAPSAAPA